MVPLRALELASVLSLLHPQAFLKPISSDPRVMGVCFGKAEETDEERTNRVLYEEVKKIQAPLP